MLPKANIPGVATLQWHWALGSSDSFLASWFPTWAAAGSTPRHYLIASVRELLKESMSQLWLI